MNELRIAVIVMVHNPYHYFSEFIVHTKNLSDHIYVIDHNSSKRFCSLNLDNVTFIESNQIRQFQSEVTNAVIRDYKIYDRYDWIFVLDVDEYLPFKSKTEFINFLNLYKNEKVLAMNWRNGVGVYPTTIKKINTDDSLINSGPLLISDFINSNIKVAVNCKNLAYPYFFGTGAHQIIKLRRLTTKLLRRNIYKPISVAKNHHFLYHIVAYDRFSFYKKIQNYVNQMELRKHVKGQGGWMVKDYLIDFDDAVWLNIIQNFRVSNIKKIKLNVDESMFSRHNLFDHLDRDEIYNLKSCVLSLEEKILFNAKEEELNYIKNKTLDTDLFKNIQSFRIDNVLGLNTVVISK